MAKRDAVIFGVRAVQALANHRPEAILRVLYLDEVKMSLGSVLKVTAAQRKPYRVVEKSDLERLCNTAHHEGVAAVARPFELPTLERAEQLKDYKRIIALDDVVNPHNVGAVARTAAWFGYEALILRTPVNTLNPASIRVSQGGVFSLACFKTPALAGQLRALVKSGVSVFGLTQRGSKPLKGMHSDGRVCLVFGNEATGLSRDTQSACSGLVRIEGSGHVESLNISVAAGIAMAHFSGSSRASV